MQSPVDRVFKNLEPVAVYGLGYVGLPLIAVYLRKGLKVIGVDIDSSKVEAVNAGELKYPEAKVLEAIKKGLSEKRMHATTDGVEASKTSVVKVVTVPVYVDWETRTPVYTAFKKAVETIGKGLKKGDLVIIESSVPPGTTESIAKPILEDISGLKADEDFYLAYSPERVYIGRAVEDIEKRYPKIIGGIGPRSLKQAAEFYKRIVAKGVVTMKSAAAAEFEKLAEGVYRDVNIALANELALAAMTLGIDYYEIREAANTQPYCNLHLPGPGVGGACIPIYPYFLSNTLLKHGFVAEMIRLARKINEYMPNIVVKLVEKYRDKTKSPREMRVAILGVAFRGDIDDTRLSPSRDVIGLLMARGYRRIIAHDPYVKYDRILEDLGVDVIQDLEGVVRNSDIIIVLTRHSMYKGMKVSRLLEVAGTRPLIVDTVAYLENDIGYDKFIVLGKG